MWAYRLSKTFDKQTRSIHPCLCPPPTFPNQGYRACVRVSDPCEQRLQMVTVLLREQTHVLSLKKCSAWGPGSADLAELLEYLQASVTHDLAKCAPMTKKDDMRNHKGR